MKSKTKAFLISLLCVLFLSCSNFLKSHSGQGRVSIVLPYGDSVVSRKALTVDKDNLDYVITISNTTDFSMTKTAKSGEKVSILLDEGNYRIDAVAYDSSDSTRKFPLYKGSTETTIVSDRTTNAELKLWRLSAANFFRNEWGDVQAGQYEYNWGADVKDLYPDFDKLLKKGDCATVTLKGVANTSFNGTIYARFAQGYHKNTWSQIGRSSRNVSFDAGEEVTLTFDLIAEEDALEITDTQFNLYYTPDAYDDELTINDFSIEFNFEPSFTAIEHSIHVGTNVYTVYSKKGADFLLPDLNYINERTNYAFWAFTLGGWYNNKNFTGNTISKISAAQNKQSMDFYAKLNLKLGKNIFDKPASDGRTYNYCGNFAANYMVEDFTELPKSGDTVEFTLEGTFNDDFEGYLYAELADNTSGWNLIINKCVYLDVAKEDPFCIYYKLVIPEGKSFTDLDHTILNFVYEYFDHDKEITIEDFKVTLYGVKYGRYYKPKSGSTKNMTLETNDNGIMVKINLLADGMRVKDVYLEECDSKTQFRLNNEVIELLKSNVYSFVWPLCKKDDIYELKLKYHNNKDDKDYYEDAFCTAGGGLVAVDYSDYDTMSISVETAEEERNVVINNFDGSNCDILHLSNDADSILEKTGFEVTLYSGVKDWTNTAWVYCYDYDFQNDAEGTIYEALQKDGKFNILKNYNNWKKPVYLNEELSERNLFYVGMRSHFVLNGFEDGVFYSKEHLSDETPYVPYIFPDSPARVNISISYPENYTPDFSVSYTTETLKDGTRTSNLSAYVGKLLDNVTYYWYMDNELVKSGSSSIWYIDESQYAPKIYDAKCIATYESNGELKVLEADFYLFVSGVINSSTDETSEDSIQKWKPESTATAYSVSNFADLEMLAEIVNGGNDLAGITITQKSDIKINDSVLGDGFVEPEESAVGEPNANLINFAGIGSKNNLFAGTYDGNGKIISGLYIYGGQQGLGFFGGLNGATIKNVVILDAAVINHNVSADADEKDDDRFGGLVGITQTGESTVENCVYVGTVGSQAALERGGAYEYAAGIIGRIEKDTIANLKNCFSLVNLYGSSAALVKKVSGAANMEDCIGVSLDKKVYTNLTQETSEYDDEIKASVILAVKEAHGIDLTSYFTKAGL